MKNNLPFISVITACFNSQETISNTINSVINQTYKNVELILIDGNSKDDTNKIINFYINNGLLSNINYKYISEDDNGISSAFNKGINLASGDFLLFLNSDDYLYDNLVFENAVKYFNSKNEIYCGSIFSEGQNKIINSKLMKSKVDYEIMHPATFIGSNVFSIVGFYDENLKIAMDFDFFLRARKLNINFNVINLVVSHFANNGISSVDINKVIYENNIARKKSGAYNLIYKIYFILGAIRVKLLRKKNKK